MSDSSEISNDELDVLQGTITNTVNQSQLDTSLQASIKHHNSIPISSSEPTQSHKQFRFHTQRYPSESVPDFRVLLNHPRKDDNCNHMRSGQPIQLHKPSSSGNIILRNMKHVSKLSQHQSILKANSSQSSRQKPRQFFDIKGRFYRYQESVQQKIIERQRELQAAEVQECTFRPSTNNLQSQRSFKSVYQSLLEYQKQKSDHLEHLRQSQNHEEIFSFMPMINQKSAKIIESNPYFDDCCHERLYDVYKLQNFRNQFTQSLFSEDLSRISNINMGPCFVPKVNKRSKDIVRTRPVDEILYDDAIRRRQIPHREFSESTVETSDKSMRILVSKFLSEFRQAIRRLDLEDMGQVNYTKFVLLCRRLRLFAQTGLDSEQTALGIRLWKQVAGERDKVPIKDLKVAFMGIMGYYQAWMSSAEGFKLDREAALAIHDKYRVLAMNRPISIRLQSKVQNQENIEKTDYKSHRHAEVVSQHSKTEYPLYPELSFERVKKSVSFTNSMKRKISKKMSTQVGVKQTEPASSPEEVDILECISSVSEQDDQLSESFAVSAYLSDTLKSDVISRSLHSADHETHFMTNYGLADTERRKPQGFFKTGDSVQFQDI